MDERNKLLAEINELVHKKSKLLRKIRKIDARIQEIRALRERCAPESGTYAFSVRFKNNTKVYNYAVVIVDNRVYITGKSGYQSWQTFVRDWQGNPDIYQMSALRNTLNNQEVKIRD